MLLILTHRMLQSCVSVEGVGIYCNPPFGALIISNINSVRYCQILELIKLALSSNPSKITFTESNPIELGMDEDSYICTAELSC